MNFNLNAILSVAYKEFLHVIRDIRIVALILVIPPFFTLLFGYAFENGALTNVPAVLIDQDQSASSESLTAILKGDQLSKILDLGKDHKFDWKSAAGISAEHPDLLRSHLQAAIVIPKGWGAGLANGDPIPIKLFSDGTDTSTAQDLEGSLSAALGKFQENQLNDMVANLPEEVIDMGQKLPEPIRKKFVSAMSPWTVQNTILYNPQLKFIDFVTPGIIGLILQLLTVTLMACTITREREAGTLSQLMVTSLTRFEIVIGKVLPYLVISLFLILLSTLVSRFYFGVHFHHLPTLALICLLFLLSSLGLGLLISAISDTQTQAIQFAIFYLLPVFPLSGAFSPIEQLPKSIHWIPELFPLTYFCRAFRTINLRGADFSYITGDLIMLALFAIVTCAIAGFLLARTED